MCRAAVILAPPSSRACGIAGHTTRPRCDARSKSRSLRVARCSALPYERLRMNRAPYKRFIASAALALAACNTHATNVLDPWVGTWGVAPQSYTGNGAPTGKTLRQIVHTSIAGTALRITVSNLYGSGPLTLSSVHAALSMT